MEKRKDTVRKVTMQNKRKKIIGYDKEKTELKELGEMLKNVEKYRALGVRIPRGLVLYGEPGVGKSVMARSIATKGINTVELRAAECCIDGAETNVKEVFACAKKNAPCVLILDELDKIAGTSRHFFMPTNSDVNKVLLQELDSLTDDDYVLVVATCNNTECLGEALLRSGRFDRQIKVQLPDETTRAKIVKHYLSKVKLKNEIDVNYVAKITYGKSCADLECVVNESAIEVIKNRGDVITIDNLRSVINKMIFDGAPEKLSENSDAVYKTAVHEAGHALVAITLLPDNIYGASIVPQGDSSGHVEFVQSENEVRSINDMKNEIAVVLAGRVAEREILKEIYLGARSDLRRALQTASDLVSKHGVYGYKHIIQQVRFDNVYVSEKTLYETENKVEEMLNEADKKASKVINDNKEKFNKIVDLLMTKQVLSREELLEIRDAS